MSSTGKKRGGGPGSRGGRGGRKAVVGPKRAAEVNSDYEEAAPPAKRKPAPPLEPRTLPERDNRGVNITRVDPVELHAKRAKRANGAGAADKAEKAQKAEDLERRRAEAIATLAAIDAEQDKAQQIEDESVIYHIDDLPAPNAMEVDNKDEPILTITQEDFERIEDDDAYRSESEFDKPERPAPAQKPRVKKPAKGETRYEIEAQAKQIVDDKSKIPAKRSLGVQDRNAAAASKKAGLSQVWVESSKGAVSDSSSDPAPLGGFTDDDANSVRPKFDGRMQAPRKNNMVGFLSSSDADETPSKPAEVKVTKTRKSQIIKSEPTSKLPALVARSTPTNVKSEAPSGSSLAASAAKDRELPEFIQASWAGGFLPCIYRAVYLSDDPMAIGAVGRDPQSPGKETVALLQTLLDKQYPGNTFVIKWGDAISKKAVSRVGEHRSAISKYALTVVDHIFDDVYYYKDADAPTPTLRKSQTIKEDARYALCSNGPAFYKSATPADVCTLDRRDPRYIKPTGFLESPAIIDTLSWFIKDEDFRVVVTETADGETEDFSGLPIGALGMVAAAVERAHKAHSSGVRTKPPDFSFANYGTAVAGFIASIKKFQRSRWESIIQSAGSRITERAGTAHVDTEPDSLDGLREYMYVPSSP
ncbi:hypothetical protein DFH07DRAFT_779455 [Mycena maculata]|uniref:Uncharacterized protein n=1 Tax=Mycena maculata TaxID=230809 RepID=A0AAD7I822_9AGAR|nr:hypothetical protein DFH07DRAFT_779455 [Mycena maculata]